MAVESEGDFTAVVREDLEGDVQIEEKEVEPKVEKEQPPVRMMLLVMLCMFQGYASMVGPLQSAYKRELGITHGTDAAHAFTQAAVGVHYGKFIARLGHNVVFACLSPWARVIIAMIFMEIGVLIPPVLVLPRWVGIGLAPSSSPTCCPA